MLLTAKAILDDFLQLVLVEVMDSEVEETDSVTENRLTSAEVVAASVTEILAAGTEEVMREVEVDSVTEEEVPTVIEAVQEGSEGTTSLILVSTFLPLVRVITTQLLPFRPSARLQKRSKPPKI